MGEELLEPTRIYVRPVLELVRDDDLRPAVRGLAHVTGGGLEENLERILPDGCGLRIDRSSWTEPAVFGWLRDLGGVAETEMRRVFNLGVGFVLVLAPDWADAATDRLTALGESPVRIGTVTADA